MFEQHQLKQLKQVSPNLFFTSVAGADDFPVQAPKSFTCSSPGQDVYIDLENHCIITRTGSGVYVSVQKDTDAMNLQISVLERLARLHS